MTHGPILGRVGSGRIGVWIRTDRPAKFQVHFGARAERMERRSPTGTTTLERDNTGWVTIEGLTPGASYHYQVWVDGAPAGAPATFRTLPSADQFRNQRYNPKGLFNFRFEFACGNNQNTDHSIGPALPAFRTMLEHVADDVDFAILNGDWLYENLREYSPDQWRQQTGTHFGATPTIVELAPTITGVWENYKGFLRDGKGDRPPNGPFVSGPRTCEIRRSTYFLPDVPRQALQYPTYCVVQVNNVLGVTQLIQGLNPDGNRKESSLESA